ncbi:MAG TPA: VOC family protein [Quisquiliibacterium sp.]|nr:VOC family protein [Quisquiliibacterium sp.]HPA89579.1 VOC family protein [Quisquiliibacterium sp.]HQP67601.1 VOC family protein [Quisquiliibacterium sp.]
MRNPVAWCEIYVQDMARAKAFYEAMLGMPLSPLEGSGTEGEMAMWAFPMQPEGEGCSGALVQMAGMPSGGNSVIVYFGCDDCAVQAGRAAAAGGRVERPKFSIGPYGFIALVVDTEGNMIGLHSMQ